MAKQLFAKSSRFARGVIGGADVDGLMRSIRKLKEAGNGGPSKEAARAFATEWLKSVASLAPRDTNRYIRGWLLGAADVEISVEEIPPLQPSRYSEYYAKYLRDQARAVLTEIVELRERMRNWFEIPGKPPTQWYLDAERRVRKLARRLQRANEEIAKYEDVEIAGTALVMDARVQMSGWKSAAGRYFAQQAMVASKLATVRNRIYGGRGAFVKAPSGAWFVQLINLEAHATIVEWKYNVVRLSTRQIRNAGVIGVTRIKFLTSLKREDPAHVAA